MDLRNIAIIAHVDHGKTTLVDQLLKQSGTFRENQTVAERAMDSNDLERERGITILAKCTSVEWTQGDTTTRINIVDTPGHADFGGEVERILSMVDGVILLVDSAEGPMPQTKFVTSKALRLGLKPIVVINKIDRQDARPDEVHEEVFDLFAALDADEEQLDFPLLYASGRDGWAVTDLSADRKDLTPLFDCIVEKVPAPKLADGAEDAPFQMLATTVERDPYLGRVLTGRISRGVVKPNQSIKALSIDGEQIESGRVTRVLAFRGLTRQPIEEGVAGDIVAIAGLSDATVAHTLCDPSCNEPIKANPIDPPTLAVTFSINDSPLAGRDGSKVQSRVIEERLMREAEGNVAIQVKRTQEKDAFEVAGRGELQIGILVETMRREDFELSISRPRVIFQKDPDTGKRLEPIEEVVIDVDDNYTGAIIEKLTARKGSLEDMRPTGGGKTRLTLHVPSRGLVGYHGEFLTDTRGTGVMNRLFHSYDEYRGPINGRTTGVLISKEQGKAVPYALWNLEERGTLFIAPGTDVYQGMIIGENARNNDLDVNPLKAKQLTNIRAAGKDDAVRVTPHRVLPLEEAIAYVADDELVEVTPNFIRLRKKELLPHMRKRAQKEEIAS